MLRQQQQQPQLHAVNSISNIFQFHGFFVFILGTFVPYDPVNAVSAPEVNGFQGGVHYADNVTKQFVAYCDGTPCSNQNPVSCCLRLVNGPGCYVTCGGGLKFDNKSVKYLLNHPQLTWVKTDTTAMQSLPNVLQVSGNGGIFFFGRVLYQGNYQVGKTHAGPPAVGYMFYFEGPSGPIAYSNGFEVLTCAPVTTTTSTTTVPTTTSTTVTTTTTLTTTTIAPCGKISTPRKTQLYLSI